MKLLKMESKDLPRGKQRLMILVCMKKICIFCEKSNQYIKNSRTKETLVQANELRADKKVRAVATARMDEKILAITSRELLAAEAHYHRTCYRDYTRAYYSKSKK